MAVAVPPGESTVTLSYSLTHWRTGVALSGIALALAIGLGAWGWARGRRSERERCMAESPPTVTVIMPVFNAAATIDRALGAVLAQDYPPDRLEVLVVDGGSVDGTPDRVRAIAGDDPRVRCSTTRPASRPTG